MKARDAGSIYVDAYEPQVGDRVRYVLEGEAGGRDPQDRALLNAGMDFSTRINPAHVVSVEKVEPPKPPLPTTPGSVIRGIASALFARSNDGQHWIGLASGDIYDEFADPATFDVLYDAGAES